MENGRKKNVQEWMKSIRKKRRKNLEIIIINRISQLHKQPFKPEYEHNDV